MQTRILFLLLNVFYVYPCTKNLFAQNVTNYVNPFIGTSGIERSLEGRTNPGAQLPFGMVSVSPFNAYDTSLARNIWDHSRMSAPYFKDRPYISGFSHINLSGVGCPDMGVILLMPTTGDVKTEPDKYYSTYQKEQASPGYYSVLLDRYNIKTEVSATLRSGISRYTFPAGKSNILLNLGLAQTNQRGAVIKIISASKIEGSRSTGRFCGANISQTVYFAIEFSKSSIINGTWNNNQISNDRKETEGSNIGAFFSFDIKRKEIIEVKIAISYVSTKNAWLNLATEQRGFEFDKIRENAAKEWNNELSRISVEGGSPDDKTIFYTGLYHTLIHPNIFNDVNGEYPALGSHEIKKTEGYARYTVFSLWDTYRNLHQLLTLVYPERQLDMIRSMLEMYKESGWLPKWELCGNETNVMVGDPATNVIADSYLKGITQFDTDLAYNAMKKGATTTEDQNELRPGIDAYIKYGYIPMDAGNKRNVWGEVSTTLEYNLADFSLSQMADRLGKTEDTRFFYSRSLGYKNLFNADCGFLAPKKRDGSWYQPFDPLYEKWPGGPGYVEGNAWHYNFFTPHDINGLIRLSGSEEKFIKKLQQCFDEKHFSMGNEPDIAYPFLFNYIKGQEWRTQKEVRNTINKNFKNTAAGLPGNDDCGTMSAWLVFAMMGIYPDCPAIPEYQLASPSFNKITITLNQQFYPGKQFVIKTGKNSKENIYIRSLQLNGKDFTQFSLSHHAIVSGGEIKFDLTPNR